MRSLRFFNFVLACFFSLAIICAQTSTVNRVSVKGIVLDSITDETIPYATIKVFGKLNPDKVEKAVPTDQDGKFQFYMNKSGDYEIVVEFMGKESAKKEFSIGNNKSLDLGTVYLKDNSQVLGEVTVSAQKPLVKVDLDKITYSIEDDPESTTSTALDMMKKVPMVTVDGEDNIQLKGSSEYKIYMNGKPSSMITSNPKDVLKSMPASSIKNIEIITDPGAKYDAEGLAGIINIITQRQTSMSGYTARVNTRADHRGGFGFGGHLTVKSGKFGFTGNYNYYDYKNPRGDASLYRHTKNDPVNTYLNQDGTTEFGGNGQFGSGEISYEIDTLNLINVGFDRYYGKSKQNMFTHALMENAANERTYEYNQRTNRDFVYGSTSANIDYQRTSAKVKERLFTFSYKFNTSPNDWSSDNRIENVYDYKDEFNRQYSDASMKEHTVQVDYTTPFAKIHVLEAGGKYINRNNKSESNYSLQNSSGDWESLNRPWDSFKHVQNIYAAYLGYNVRVQKWGFKTGVRYEATNLDVKYKMLPDSNFVNDYSNLVPSATISYQLSPIQNIRFGYNMRILRPGIWQLNPFPNSTDAQNEQIGNPRLDAVKSHALNMNYSYFNPKFNFNANLTYNFSDNNIERVTIIEGDVSKRIFQNVAENKKLGLFVFFNWSPTPKLRITSNLSGSYIDLRADGIERRNHGFTSNYFGNVAYTLPKNYKISGYGGGMTPNIYLENRGASYNYYGLSVSKDFMGDKLSVNLMAMNFLSKMNFKDELETPEIYMKSNTEFNQMRLGLSVSFKFGELKSQIKKTKRGISNDDVINNSGGNGGGQGGQPSGG